MSLRYEQERALLKSRDFLRALLSPRTRPKGVRALVRCALGCLRHFPPLAASGRPMWSEDKFGPPFAWGEREEPCRKPFSRCLDCEQHNACARYSRHRDSLYRRYKTTAKLTHGAGGGC